MERQTGQIAQIRQLTPTYFSLLREILPHRVELSGSQFHGEVAMDYYENKLRY
jgi:hypothetical protein